MAPGTSVKGTTKQIKWKNWTHYWNKQFKHTLSYTETPSGYTKYCCYRLRKCLLPLLWRYYIM